MLREDYPFWNFRDEMQIDEAILVFEQEIEDWDIDLIVYHNYMDPDFEQTGDPVSAVDCSAGFNIKTERNTIMIPENVGDYYSHDAMVLVFAHELGHIYFDDTIYRRDLVDDEGQCHIDAWECWDQEYRADAWAYDFVIEKLGWSKQRYWDAFRAMWEGIQQCVGSDSSNAMWWIEGEAHPTWSSRWLSVVSHSKGLDRVHIHPMDIVLPDFLKPIDEQGITDWEYYPEVDPKGDGLARMPETGTWEEAADWMTERSVEAWDEFFKSITNAENEAEFWAVMGPDLASNASLTGVWEGKEFSPFYTYVRSQYFEPSHILLNVPPMEADLWFREHMPQLPLEKDEGVNWYTQADTHVDFATLLDSLLTVVSELEESVQLVFLGEDEIRKYQDRAEEIWEADNTSYDSWLKDIGEDESDPLIPDGCLVAETASFWEDYLRSYEGTAVCEVCGVLCEEWGTFTLNDDYDVVCLECFDKDTEDESQTKDTQ